MKDIATYLVPVGKYHLDLDRGAEVDETKIRVQLVLSKLHHVVRLMDQLVGRLKSMEAGACAPYSEAVPIAASLQAFMQQRVRAMTKEIIDVL